MEGGREGGGKVSERVLHARAGWHLIIECVVVGKHPYTNTSISLCPQIVPR